VNAAAVAGTAWFGRLHGRRARPAPRAVPESPRERSAGHAGGLNFVAHIAIGVRLGYDDPAVLVGTALPDFAGMARLTLRTASGAVADGIAVHHTTDRVFHADDWFLDLQTELRASFRDDGLPEGAARACAHVGPELLLDGALVRDVGVRDALAQVYDRLASPSDAIVELVDVTERARWGAFLARVADRVDPCGYEDAGVVAKRLHAVTARRPRLAFAACQLSAVTTRLRDVQPRVVATAPAVMTRVADAASAARAAHAAL
jgi:hypothetical protein